jgi:hypothetical protein
MKTVTLVSIALVLLCGAALAQAPGELLQKLPPSPKTKVVKITFVNRYDNSPGEALLEVPAKMHGPTPLIISPHGANWTPEMNRSLWSGVADDLGVLIIHPVHQGKVNPRVSFGSARQMGNLESAIETVEKNYPVDKKRVYAAGISQGAIESLLLAGRHPERFAGALAMNPVADFAAFYNDAPTFQALLKVDLGGTPDAARAEYDRRSPVHYAKQLSRVPVIIYWADNDELIPRGVDHQGGPLCAAIRTFHPAALKEVRHSKGHGYPFFGVDPVKQAIEFFPRSIFLSTVKEMLQSRRTGSAPNRSHHPLQ